MNLVHTKLEASFDYNKSYLLGKAWITMKPHFYPTDSVQLDAKGMTIHRVMLGSATNKALPYTYNGLVLTVRLDKVYTSKEQYTLYIEYTAKPNEFKANGSAAIKDAKGLYFINPLGKEKNKATQIWTQGETEGTSVWCPTIDRPNQKTTSEMILTVPAQFVSLSNGKLFSQKDNKNGTRIDHWKMELPHAPYLFFIGIGDYAVIKDSYKSMEVSYYVEKEYAAVARKIFGKTPEMIAFFEKITGVAYPWAKYAQMTAQDYVSGAMENTTATLHSSAAQQDARELIDENTWETIIAHELFHQWLGDYVTAESWSNLTVNESFADYSEYLWNEYKYGPDVAQEEMKNDKEQYMGDSLDAKKNLVRFYYADKEDMFDAVSYQKGGIVLHMLRQYVGDSAFFKGLNKYLVDNKFGTGEAHQFRIALEAVSGKDLNWFFNQWYFGSGHPIVDIRYAYDDKSKQVTVSINQLQQKVFQIPLKVDLYEGEKKKTYSVWVDQAKETFTFPYSLRPDLVNVDPDKFMLWKKTDRKTISNYVFQYHHGNYIDRREAFLAALSQPQNAKSLELIKFALKDKSDLLRQESLYWLGSADQNLMAELEPVLVDLATNDASSLVKGEALNILGQYKKASYKELFKKNLSDSSYTVAGGALNALSAIDLPAAESFALTQRNLSIKGSLYGAVANVFMLTEKQEYFSYLITYYKGLPWWEMVGSMQDFGEYLIKVKNDKNVLEGVDLILKSSESLLGTYRDYFYPGLMFAIQNIADKKRASGNKKLAAEIEKKIPKE